MLWRFYVTHTKCVVRTYFVKRHAVATKTDTIIGIKKKKLCLVAKTVAIASAAVHSAATGDAPRLEAQIAT